LCDYLAQTNDAAILHERLPYTNEETFQRTEHREELLQHVDRLLQRLREQFLPGLALPRYGEGDWDDSLQPADPTLRQRMVSSWTTELMYQTLKRYATALERMGQKQRADVVDSMAQQIHRDFHRYLMPDGIVAGLAIFDGDPPRPVEYLLHPSDARTGIQYRLIPMTRGILSEMFSPRQAQEHLSLIREHLLFPDGARLMDRPTEYSGGQERTFRRSESAAFFGREIGLQYVHAHLRYAEAMAKLGRADDLWHALQVVNPIAVTELVRDARPRQRNCYFSSSDARFDSRYEAWRDYDKLRAGEIPTDGGWRIYSSGPGIYTNLVIRHLLGLREHFDSMEFDPVLTRELNGLKCELMWRGHRVKYEFELRERESAGRAIWFNGQFIAFKEVSSNPYRTGGICIPKRAFEAFLKSGLDHVKIRF
jgi:cellobiose phosphorylase